MRLKEEIKRAQELVKVISDLQQKSVYDVDGFTIPVEDQKLVLSPEENQKLFMAHIELRQCLASIEFYLQ